MAQDSNPYAAPQGDLVTNAATAYGEVKVFSASGRLNRLRYLTYGFGIPFLIYLAASAVSAPMAAAGDPGTAYFLIQGVAWIAILWISILLAIQRLHDFNSSGWWSVLVIVPLVSLIYLLIPGNQGENRFGLQPPPNTLGVVLVAIVAVGIPILGIVAAILIPQMAASV